MPGKKPAAPASSKLEWGKIIIPALIGLLGVITTAVCGFLTTIAVNMLPDGLAGLPIGRPAATETLTMAPPPPTFTPALGRGTLPTDTLPAPTRALPTISFELMDFNLFLNSMLDLYGKRQDNEYLGIVPQQCFSLYVLDDPHPTVVKTKDQVALTYNFLVMSDAPVILSDVSLYLDRFKPPPEPESLASAVYIYGRGGGGAVDTYTLDDVTVSSQFSHASLNGGKAYRLEENDALTFTTHLYFTEPGEYQVHFELQAETFTADTFAYASPGLKFSWLYLDDIRRVKLVNMENGEEMRADNPPCPQ
jgi:hypothetical protein